MGSYSISTLFQNRNKFESTLFTGDPCRTKPRLRVGRQRGKQWNEVHRVAVAMDKFVLDSGRLMGGAGSRFAMVVDH
jgi:hypothetical protein